MRVALGTFARSEIEAQCGSDLAAGVRKAILHYAHRIEAGDEPVGYPRFRRAVPRRTAWPDLDLDLDVATMLTLRLQVRRRGAPMAMVAAHAVLVYLAHLDQETGTPVA